MRTTLRIDDELYRRVKAEAARSGRTVAEVVEDALRVMLQPQARRRPVPDLPVYGAGGPLPGVDLEDAAALRDAMNGSAVLDALR